MIILSQVEPILEPIFESDYWYLPNQSQATTARVTSLLGYLQQRPQRPSTSTRFIPPFELGDRFLQFFGLPQFQPNELEIKLDREQRQLIISGQHERNDEMEFECCTFFKRILIPNDVDLDRMKCFIADNGLLQIEAPIINQQNVDQPQPIINYEQREVPIEMVKTSQPAQQQQSNLNKESVDFGFQQPTSGQNDDRLLRSKRRGAPGPPSPQPDQPDSGVGKAERVIPIEMVGPRFQNPLMPDVALVEASFQPTQHAQLHQAINAAPVTFAGSLATAFGPPPPGLAPVRELPIRVRKRPIDQGILCPCCNGRGSRHHHGQEKHEHMQQQFEVPSQPQSQSGTMKKDYQPKNASTGTATAEVQQGSGIISQEDLMQAIEALQMVAGSNKDSATK